MSPDGDPALVRWKAESTRVPWEATSSSWFGVCKEVGARAESQAGGGAWRSPSPPEPHSVPLSSWQQCPLPCCTQGHDCQHFYPLSDFTVSTQVFRDMQRSHSLHKVGEPWCLEVGHRAAWRWETQAGGSEMKPSLGQSPMGHGPQAR